MIKNFNVPLLDARGRAVGVDGELAKEGEPSLLLADVAILACQNPCEGDNNLSASQKIKLGSLAIRIGEATGEGKGPRDYEQGELDLIKERAAKNVQIMAFFRLCEMIDAAAKIPALDSDGRVPIAVAVTDIKKDESAVLVTTPDGRTVVSAGGLVEALVANGMGSSES